MPRFTMNHITTPPLSETRIYDSDNDPLNLIGGYGIDHNIILLDKNEHSDNVINSIEVFKNHCKKIKIARDCWNYKVLYNYLRKLSNETSLVNKDKLPPYSKVKDKLTLNVYNIDETMLLMREYDLPYITRDYEMLTEYFVVDGEEINISLLNMANDIGMDKAIIKMPIEYYAIGYDIITIEDNPLNIYPYEYSKYLPVKYSGEYTDKKYQIGAMKVIGLSTGFIDQWIDNETVVKIEWSDNEFNRYYPPIYGFDPSIYPEYNEWGDDECDEF